MDVKINLGNLTKVYAGNVKSSNDLVLQRYVIMVIYLMVTMVTMVTMVIIVTVVTMVTMVTMGIW